jgi:hypothetical protein
MYYIVSSAFLGKLVRSRGSGSRAGPPGELLPEKDAVKDRHTVGELMYLESMTQPSLSYATGYLARHLKATSMSQ